MNTTTLLDKMFNYEPASGGSGGASTRDGILFSYITPIAVFRKGWLLVNVDYYSSSTARLVASLKREATLNSYEFIELSFSKLLSELVIRKMVGGELINLADYLSRADVSEWMVSHTIETKCKLVRINDFVIVSGEYALALKEFSHWAFVCFNTNVDTVLQSLGEISTYQDIVQYHELVLAKVTVDSANDTSGVKPISHKYFSSAFELTVDGDRNTESKTVEYVTGNATAKFSAFPTRFELEGIWQVYRPFGNMADVSRKQKSK